MSRSFQIGDSNADLHSAQSHPGGNRRVARRVPAHYQPRRIRYNSGSILAFTAYGYALSHLPVTTVSTYAYVNPVVAVLARIVFLGEQFTWREGFGAALVLASVIITMHRSRSTSRPAPVRDGEMPDAEMLPANAAAPSRR